MDWELELAMVLGYLAAIGGQWLVAKKSRSGFGWGLVGNFIWVGIGIYMEAASMMLFSTLWAIPNLRGLREWDSPPRTYSTDGVFLDMSRLGRVRKRLIRLLAGAEIPEAT